MSVVAVNLRLTYQDFLDFPEDGRRHEIVEGEHWVTPAPNRRHQQTSMTLSYWLRGFLENRPVGQVYAARFDVILSDEDIVEPDLVFISRERLGILCDEGARGAPDLWSRFRPPADLKPFADLSREACEVLTTPLLPDFELPLGRLVTP